MTDELWDDAELIEAESILTSNTLDIRRSASTEATRERFAELKKHKIGSSWVEGVRVFIRGPCGTTCFDFMRLAKI